MESNHRNRTGSLYQGEPQDIWNIIGSFFPADDKGVTNPADDKRVTNPAETLRIAWPNTQMKALDSLALRHDPTLPGGKFKIELFCHQGLNELSSQEHHADVSWQRRSGLGRESPCENSANCPPFVSSKLRRVHERRWSSHTWCRVQARINYPCRPIYITHLSSKVIPHMRRHAGYKRKKHSRKKFFFHDHKLFQTRHRENLV